MLTREENERLTRVGPGTPIGQLLRRYWHPICPASDLTASKPLKRLRVLGEDLVVFRLPDGRYGLLQERCQHRGASLYYGFLEEEGLRCAYHGWKYALDGHCLEQPFEPAGSHFKERVCQPAYSIEPLAGLLFAYLGPPQRKPLVPRWDVLARTDGQRTIFVHPVLEANWLQPMENAVDTVHTYFLHGHMMKMKGIAAGQYYLRPIVNYEFEPFEWGIIKRRTYGGDQPETEAGHPLIFPNALRVPTGPFHALHWRVPIDDERTQIFEVEFAPTSGPTEGGGGAEQPDDVIPVEYLPSGMSADGEYDMLTFPSQDKMAYETAGSIFDRSVEHLGASDRGIALYRKMLREQVAIVEQGGDPMALVWDPAANEIIRFNTSRGQATWAAQASAYYERQTPPTGLSAQS